MIILLEDYIKSGGNSESAKIECVIAIYPDEEKEPHDEKLLYNKIHR